MSTLVIAVGAFLYWSSSRSADSFILSPGVLAQLDQDGTDAVVLLQRDPCNRTAAAKLGNQLIKHDEYSAIVSFYQSQVKRCGDSDELFSMLYFAQMGLSDFVSAEKTANRLVELFPADYNSYGWRSEAREKLGNLNGAYSDMRKALDRFPDPANVAVQPYYDTARLAAQTGHPCEAVVTLRDYIAYDATQRRTQQLKTLMREWQQAGSCAPLAGVGSALVRYSTSDGSMVVIAEINGVPAHMIVDTGATVTLITADMALRSGIKQSDQGDVSIVTANGNTIVSGGRADSISIGNASLKNAPVYVQRPEAGSMGDHIDGLLGLSFLGNFELRIVDGSLELKALE